MELEGKRVIILVEQMYNEFEFWYPYYRIKEAGGEVLVVGSKKGIVYHSKVGLPCKSEFSADVMSSDDCDGLIIPGGYAPDHMRRNPEMVKLVRQVFESGKVVAAICHAGWMIASAGIVKGKTLTSFFSIKDDLVNAGAIWVDREVVEDDNLITSRRPDDLPAFMKAFIKALS